MNALARFDEWVLTRCDAAVLWLWNTFSLRRIIALRLLAIVWIVGSSVCDIAAETFGVFDGVWAVAMLLAFSIEEWRAAAWTPRLINSHVAASRGSAIRRVLRLSVLLVAIVPLPGGGQWAAPKQAFSLLGAMFLYALDTFTPEDPPRRKERQIERRLAPQPIARNTLGLTRSARRGFSLRYLITGIFAAFLAGPALADPCEAIPDKGPMPAYLGRGKTFSGPVVYVGDGDGMCVAVGNVPTSPESWVEVRLADFYAPELNGLGGREAKQALERIAMGRRATCTAEHRSWDRIVATCVIDGVSVGDRLRRAGIREGGNR